jgi:peptidoglycan-associated lipoprotein
MNVGKPLKEDELIMLDRPVNVISVRRTVRATVQILALALMLGMAMGSTSCSWFRKGDKADKGKTKPVAEISGGDSKEIKLPPPSPPDDSHKAVTIEDASKYFLLIYFDFDKANIRKDQLERIEKNLQYLKENKNRKVLIEGHCDERGTTEYNFALGERRARAVMDYFTKGGIAGDRLQTLSKGEEEPVDPGHDEAAWTKNRRAAFKFFQ